MSTATELALAEAELELAQAQGAAVQPEPDMSASSIAGDVGKAAVKGLGLAGEFVGDIADYAIVHPLSRMMPDYLPSTQFDPEIAQQGRDQIKEMAAPSLERTTEQGVSPVLDATLTGTEYAASSLVPLAGLSKAKLLKEAAIFGGGAAGGSLVSGDDDIASLLGGLGASTRGYGIPALGKGLYKTIQGMLGKGKAPVAEANTVLMNFADDAETAQKRLNAALDAGERGTIGQLTGDKGILALEKRQVGAGGSQFSQKLNDINEKLASGAIETIESVPPAAASPEAFKQAAKERVSGGLSKVREIATKQADKAEAAGLQKARAIEVSTGQEALETGQRLSKSVGKMREAAKAEQTAYNIDRLNDAAPQGLKITEAGPDSVMAIKQNIDQQYDDAWGQFRRVTNKSVGEFKDIALKGDEIEAVVLNKIVSAVEDLKQYPTVKQARTVDEMIRNQIETAATGKTQIELTNKLKEMRVALRKTLPKGAQDDISRLNENYDKYLTVREAAAKADPDGLMKAEEVWSEGKRIGGKLAAATHTGPMMQSTKPSLGRAKEVAENIKQSEKATESIVGRIKETGAQKISAVEKETSQTAKVLRDRGKLREGKVKKSVTARILESEKPEEAIAVVLGSKNPVRSMKQLAATARKGGKESQEGLKRAVVNHFVNSVKKSDGTLKPDTVKQFDDMAESLAGVFSPQELQKMRKAATETDKIYASAGVHASDIPEVATGVPFLLATVMGVNVGSKMATNPLMGAAFGKRIVTQLGKTIPNKRLKETLNDMLLNPKKYQQQIDDLGQKPTTEAVTEFIQKVLGKAPKAQEVTEQ